MINMLLLSSLLFVIIMFIIIRYYYCTDLAGAHDAQALPAELVARLPGPVARPHVLVGRGDVPRRPKEVNRIETCNRT